jgi:hypothetical protein
MPMYLEEAKEMVFEESYILCNTVRYPKIGNLTNVLQRMSGKYIRSWAKNPNTSSKKRYGKIGCYHGTASDDGDVAVIPSSCSNDRYFWNN